MGRELVEYGAKLKEYIKQTSTANQKENVS